MSSEQVRMVELGDLGPSALLDLLGHALDTLHRLPLTATVSDSALVAGVQALQRVENRAGAEKLRWIGEIDQREAWRGQGARSTVDLLSDRLGVTKGEARAHTETAARGSM